MSQKYALPCGCGNKLSIEARQAGDAVSCSECGQLVNVPKLRDLRNLEVLEQPKAKRSLAWTPFQGGLFAAGVLAAVIAAGSTMYTNKELERYEPYMKRQDPSTYEFPDISLIPLESSWELWKELKTIRLDSRPEPMHVRARTEASKLQFWKNGFAILAGIGGLAILSSLIMSFFVRPRT